MVRPPCCDKLNLRKGIWNEGEEDAEMLEFVAKPGTGNWQVGSPKQKGLRRCGKSCRLKRTSNMKTDHLRHESFTPQEEELIIRLHSAIGSRWPVIAQQLGRTDNDVKNYWNSKLKKKLSAMGIDPVTHRPFSQMLADYGNISGLTRSRTQMGSLNRGIKSTFMSTQDIQQEIPSEKLFANFNDNVKMEPTEMITTDSLDLLTQLQAITDVKETSMKHNISFSQFQASLASSSSSTSSTSSALNETTPQQSFNWRDFLIENAQEQDTTKDMSQHDKNIEENPSFGTGGMESIMGAAPIINAFKEAEENRDGSFVEAMLDGENDMLLDFPSFLGDPPYF